MQAKVAEKGVLALFLASVLALSLINPLVKAERRLGVKVGDWVRYEYVTFEVAGKHLWMKFEVQNVQGTKVTVFWTTGPSGATIPSGMPTFGLTISWDVASGGGVFSYFIIHADAKVGDSVNIMGLLPLQIQGETTRTYAGANRETIYASYSSLGLQNSYYWDKETGVLLEYSWTMGGIEMTIKAVDTNLWGQRRTLLWVLGLIITIIVVVTLTIIVFLKKKPPARVQAARACPLCGRVLRYDFRLNRWYCERCRRHY